MTPATNYCDTFNYDKSATTFRWVKITMQTIRYGENPAEVTVLDYPQGFHSNRG